MNLVLRLRRKRVFALFLGDDLIAPGQRVMRPFEYRAAVGSIQNGHRRFKRHLQKLANTTHRIRGITRQIAEMELVNKRSFGLNFLDLLLQDCRSQQRLVSRARPGKPECRRRRIYHATADFFRIAPNHYEPRFWKLASQVVEPVIVGGRLAPPSGLTLLRCELAAGKFRQLPPESLLAR